MSFFNPRIYNKQNLKNEDRKELEYWHDVFSNMIENARDSYIDTGSKTLDNVVQEIIDSFCEDLKSCLGVTMQENVVSIIDGYGEEHETPELENYDTFLYEGKDK